MDFKRTTTRVYLLVAALVAAVLVPLSTEVLPSAALDGAEFDPGYIISDENFYNGTAMSEMEIQRLLEQTVGSCQNSNCLAVYRSDTPTRTWSFGTCTTYVGGTGESAARIIYKVQRACNLSAKVLLVTLQKEQSLLTNPAPSDGVMRKAMGYGCPDTAECDSTYYGFFNQIFAAARQLTWYGNPDGSFTSIKIGQYNAIRYHPNAGCGTKDVLVRNRATAALYYYTPYTPNAAALANLGGTGDACSAYGNRNFWVFYNNWFGPTTDPGGTAIWSLWQSLGAAEGPLGSPTSGIGSIPQNGGGLGQAYVGGSIYWSSSTGAHYVPTGPIRDYYFARAGAAGVLAFPASPPSVIRENGGGSGQVFQRGSVYSSDLGTFTVTGPIRDAYWAHGGAAGTLGWPTAEQSSSSAKGGGAGQGFQAGAVFSSRWGSWPVLGDFYLYYAGRGNATGELGWPASARVAIPQNGGGVGQAFSDGSLYQRAGGAPIAVTGGVRALYFTAGGASGPMGWPAAERSCTAGACVQQFQNAAIRSDGSGVSWFSPAIDQAYANGGGAAALGAPISDYLFLDQNGGGVARAYGKASIYSSQAGTFVVAHAMRDRYFAAGGAAGNLGWPTGPEICGLPAGGCSQSFHAGSIFWMPGDVGRITTSELFGAYAAAGGPTGSLGSSRSDAIAIDANGGGLGQAFANGSIYSKPARGTIAVVGPIRDAYFGRGGASGHLGWPVTTMGCSAAAGPCRQGFEYGTIEWSAATGAAVH